jgi:hypothetical protein
MLFEEIVAVYCGNYMVYAKSKMLRFQLLEETAHIVPSMNYQSKTLSTRCIHALSKTEGELKGREERNLFCRIYRTAVVMSLTIGQAECPKVLGINMPFSKQN